MKFSPLTLGGTYLIELEPYSDERGFFARQFCKRELQEIGIDFDICQCNLSKNYKKGTLRGLHYQCAPALEAKIVSCPNGVIYDVIVDLRKDSPTYLKWVAAELNETKMLYIPPNFAHGFQTLEDDTLVYYQLGNYFAPEYYCGLRWNDPKLDIKWPECSNRIINDRDNSYKFI